jgi:hypothetical protein
MTISDLRYFLVLILRLPSAHTLHAGAPEPHPYKFESRRVTSSLLVSSKDKVVSSGSHPASSGPGLVCCVRAKPALGV